MLAENWTSRCPVVGYPTRNPAGFVEASQWDEGGEMRRARGLVLCTNTTRSCHVLLVLGASQLAGSPAGSAGGALLVARAARGLQCSQEQAWLTGGCSCHRLPSLLLHCCELIWSNAGLSVMILLRRRSW